MLGQALIDFSHGAVECAVLVVFCPSWEEFSEIFVMAAARPRWCSMALHSGMVLSVRNSNGHGIFKSSAGASYCTEEQ